MEVGLRGDKVILYLYVCYGIGGECKGLTIWWAGTVVWMKF